MDFHSLKTREDVSRFFGIDDKQLRYMLYVTKPDNCYSVFSVPKKNGNVRTISIPNSKLKHLQEKVLRELEKQYVPKKCAYGFIKGKDFIQNAKRHLDKKIILNIDLKDFFNQIHYGRVRGILMAQPYGLGKEAASVITRICCYNQCLPQGAPTSPIIANMVANCLDTKLIALAKKYRLTYTRYADDITFSTNRTVFPNEIVQINNGVISLGSELEAIFLDTNFLVNNDKIRIQTKKQRQEVTGIIVNEKLNVRRSYINEIRILLYKIKKEGVHETAKNYIIKNEYKYGKYMIYTRADNENNKEQLERIIKNVLKGKIRYLGNVRGKYNSYYLKYAKLYNEVFGTVSFDIAKEEEITEICRQNVFVIEDISGELSQGSGVYVDGRGILTNYHVIEEEGEYWAFRFNEKIKKQFNKKECIPYDKNIDFAWIPYNIGNGLKISSNPSYETGKKVTIAGYPNYASGDSCTIEKCEITGTKMHCGKEIISISGIVIHGASGGAVLDEKHELIGILRTGNEPEDLGKGKTRFISGFIPITDIF